MIKKPIKLSKGESVRTYASNFEDKAPEVLIVGRGKLAYLWVGGEGGPCYATLSGRGLRALRDAITAALSETEGK